MANSAPSDTDLLDIGEAAELLGVSTETLRNWVKRGLIEAQFTPTKRRKFRRGDVVNALKPANEAAAS